MTIVRDDQPARGSDEVIQQQSSVTGIATDFITEREIPIKNSMAAVDQYAVHAEVAEWRTRPAFVYINQNIADGQTDETPASSDQHKRCAPEVLIDRNDTVILTEGAEGACQEKQEKRRETPDNLQNRRPIISCQETRRQTV